MKLDYTKVIEVGTQLVLENGYKVTITEINKDALPHSRFTGIVKANSGDIEENWSENGHSYFYTGFSFDDANFSILTQMKEEKEMETLSSDMNEDFGSGYYYGCED